MAQAGAARRLKAVEDVPPPRKSQRNTTVEALGLNDVREFAESLPEKFLQCRELTHNWMPFNVGRHRDGGYERTLRCSRCKTRKIQHLTTDGMLVGTARYEHPEGYLTEGLGRIDSNGRGMLRVVSMQRSMTKGGE